MPPMHIGVRVDTDAGTIKFFPLVPTPCSVRAPVAGMGGRAGGRWFYQPHWPEHAVEEALKIGVAFMGKFHVNPHNRNEAYYMIDGISVDVLITGPANYAMKKVLNNHIFN